MSIKNIIETTISDGNGNPTKVRVGDNVDLLPINPNNEEGEDGKYLSRYDRQSMLRFLEEKGPYKISWMGVWPCGGVNLYLELPGGREPGASSSFFMKTK